MKKSDASIENFRKLPLFFSLLGFAILFRCFSIWPNLSPVLGIALFLGAVSGRPSFSNAWGVWGTLLILVVSDSFLGFHDTMPFVYAPLLLMGFLGSRIRRDQWFSPLLFASSGSLLFFAVSNFGVWFSASLYSKTWAGLLECYAAAIPFYRWTLLGDLIFTGAVFGIYALVGESKSSALESAGK